MSFTLLHIIITFCIGFLLGGSFGLGAHYILSSRQNKNVSPSPRSLPPTATEEPKKELLSDIPDTLVRPRDPSQQIRKKTLSPLFLEPPRTTSPPLEKEQPSRSRNRSITSETPPGVQPAVPTANSFSRSAAEPIEFDRTIPLPNKGRLADIESTIPLPDDLHLDDDDRTQDFQAHIADTGFAEGFDILEEEPIDEDATLVIPKK